VPVLDQNVATATGDFADVITAFSLLDRPGARGVQAISGQNYAGFSSLGVQTAQLFMNNFAQQAGGGRPPAAVGAAAASALAEACDVACDATPRARWSAWGGALGGVGTIAGSPAAPGLSFNIGGFAAGIDRRFDGGFLVGVDGRLFGANAYTQTMPGQGTANTSRSASMASTARQLLPRRAGGLCARRQPDDPADRDRRAFARAPRSDRPGPTSSSASSRPATRSRSAGRGSPSSRRSRACRARPRAQAGFTETGADSLNLTVAGQTTNSLRSVFGVQAGASFDLGWREQARAGAARLGWSHEYADTARPVNASFAGAPASPFTCRARRRRATARSSGWRPARRSPTRPASICATTPSWLGATPATSCPAGVRIIW
jgi:hypothetical protein